MCTNLRWNMEVVLNKRLNNNIHVVSNIINLALSFFMVLAPDIMSIQYFCSNPALCFGSDCALYASSAAHILKNKTKKTNPNL